MVVSKTELEHEYCKALDPQADFSKAFDEMEKVRVILQRSQASLSQIWGDEDASMELCSRIYRLFNIFVDMASLEYKRGCHRHAFKQLKEALAMRDAIPAHAVARFLSSCKDDPGACQLDLHHTNKAMAARALRKELKYFQLAPSKIRVTCAKILLQLGGTADVTKAGKLFGEAIEIGLRSCLN